MKLTATSGSSTNDRKLETESGDVVPGSNALLGKSLTSKLSNRYEPISPKLESGKLG